MLLTFSRYLSVPALAAYCSALLWIFLANFGWTNEPPIAMSAVLASTLLVGSFLLMGRYLISALGSNRQGIASRYFGGLLLGFLILTRINVGLLALLVSMLLVMIIALKRRAWTVTVPPLAGAFSPILVLVVYYFFVDGLASLWDDVIVYPRTYHANAVFRENIEPFITGERSLLPVALVAISALILLFTSSPRVRPYLLSLPTWTRGRIVASLAAALVISVLLLTTFVYVTRKNVQFFSTQGASQSMRFLMWALLGLVGAAAAWAVVSIARQFLFRNPSKAISTPCLVRLYLALMSISGLSILVPWLGPRYVWWGIPLGLLLLCWTVWDLPFRETYRRMTLLALVSITVLGAFLASVTILSVPREKGAPNTAVAGMLIGEATASTINSRFVTLRQVYREYGQLVPLCKESAYVIVDNSYASHNKYHLYDPTWFPLPEITAGVLAAIQENSSPIVVCGSLSTDWGRQLKTSNSYRLMSSADSEFHIFLPS
jgi:hypothetical protein